MVLDDYQLTEVDYDNDPLLKEYEFREVPPGLSQDQKQFRFQGYRVYQLLNANVSPGQYDDVSVAREIATLDLKDSITTIYNWNVIDEPNTGGEYFVPKQQVAATNSGIKHTLSFKDDAFALGNDKQLINHKQYYYSIVAYAYNNWETFKAFPNGIGQKFNYLPGRLDVKAYTVIPRSSIDGVLQSDYGDGVAITRLEGVGVGGNAVELNADTKAQFPQTDANGILTYENGKGPFTVTLFNPYEVKTGNFEVRFTDDTPNDGTIDASGRWQLVNLDNGNVITSETTIFKLNEQIVAEYGFSITIAQTEETGAKASLSNGAIGVEYEYANPAGIWLGGVPDGASPTLDFIQTEDFANDQALDPFQGLTKIGDGGFVPFYLCNWRHGSAERLITPMWMPAQNALAQAALGDVNVRGDSLGKTPNIDLVLTSDKSKWSRCVVVETANFYYTGSIYPKNTTLNYKTQGPDEASDDPSKWRRMFDTRWADSVDKEGKPDGTGTKGFGWFPGYAVDVETGQRLNVFFGENSCYKSDLDPSYTGRDMIFNPTSQILTNDFNLSSINFNDREYFDYILGGQHFIYVTNEPYDECVELAKSFDPSNFSNPNTAASGKRSGVRKIKWTSMAVALPSTSVRSIADGLIPTETRIKARVQNPYQVRQNPNATGNSNNGYPRYTFSIQGQERRDLAGVELDNALDQIRVVPNPYYGFSQYENNSTVSTVKITNLPGKCTVTIYSLDGKFIRTFNRDEQYMAYDQISDALDWDMKNSKGIPIASGVYIIHVKSPQGERTLKWFGISRKFDPGNL